MAERKTKEELNAICKKYNVPFMWSWSRYNTYKTDHYSYFLKYVKNIKEDRRDSIYAVSGGYCHDIIEKYYNGTITQYCSKQCDYDFCNYFDNCIYLYRMGKNS